MLNLLNKIDNTILFSIKRFVPSNLKRINKNHLIYCPTSVSLPSAWSFGLLAGMCVFVAMNYYTSYLNLFCINFECFLNEEIFKYFYSNKLDLFLMCNNFRIFKNVLNKFSICFEKIKDLKKSIKFNFSFNFKADYLVIFWFFFLSFLFLHLYPILTLFYICVILIVLQIISYFYPNLKRYLIFKNINYISIFLVLIYTPLGFYAYVKYLIIALIDVSNTNMVSLIDMSQNCVYVEITINSADSWIWKFSLVEYIEIPLFSLKISTLYILRFVYEIFILVAIFSDQTGIPCYISVFC